LAITDQRSRALLAHQFTSGEIMRTTHAAHLTDNNAHVERFLKRVKMLAVLLLAAMLASASLPAWAVDCTASDTECVSPQYGDWEYTIPGIDGGTGYIWACGANIRNLFTSQEAAVAALKQSEECGNNSESTITATFVDSWAPQFSYPSFEYSDPSCYAMPEEGFSGTGPDNWYVCQSAGNVWAGTSTRSRVHQDNVNGEDADWLGPRLRRSRLVSCPSGYTKRLDVAMNWETCFRVAAGKGKHDRNVGDCCVTAGNPINVAAGSKLETTSDGVIGTGFPIELVRIYDSQYSLVPNVRNWPKSGIGNRWKWKLTSSITAAFDLMGGRGAVVVRPDGKVARFQNSGSSWQPKEGVTDVLKETVDGTGATIGWTYQPTATRVTESYNANGRLERVSDGNGRFHSYTYDASGRLDAITDESGRFVKFKYMALQSDGQQVDDDGTAGAPTDQVRSIQDSGGRVWVYGYEAATRNLVSVTYPDDSKALYHYEDPNGSSLLTGISSVSAQGETTRFATYSYDASGLATNTAHAGNASSFSLEYLPNSQTKVTRLIDSTTGSTQSSVYTFAPVFGRLLPTALSAPCYGCSNNASTTYDSFGFPNLVTDFKGAVTDYDYNSRGLVTQKIESANTAASKRTTQQDWHSAFDVVTERRVYDSSASQPGVLKAKTTWTHNTRGQVLSTTQVDPAKATNTRITTIAYCEQENINAGTCPLLGLITSINGPRTDVADITTFTYYPSDDASCAVAPTVCPHRKGDLWKVTNAAGYISEILRYDGSGRVLATRNPNGVVRELSYTPRGWLRQEIVQGVDDASAGDDAITQWEHNPIGEISKIIQPDGDFISFGYDAARRLTDISDAAGNTIHYALDPAGNRSREDTKDAAGTLTRTLGRVFDNVGRVQQTLNSINEATLFTYDTNSNPDLTSDALGRTADQDYDPLNRLIKMVHDVGGLSAVSQIKYDASDNVTAIIDPKALTTTYAYDGLNNLIKLISPDTGTSTFVSDSAGNRTSQTDARKVSTNYSYDVLNRLILVSYPGSTVLNSTFVYDTLNSVCLPGESYPKGHLTKFTDASGTTQLCYTRFGDLTRKVQTNNGVVQTTRYEYTLAGRLLSVTYPSGTQAVYSRGAIGQIASIEVTPAGGGAQNVIASATYAPFGPLTQLTYGNGRTQVRTYDTDYALRSIHDPRVGGVNLDFGVDAVGNLTQVSQGATGNSFGYDGLNRLKTVKSFLDAPVQTFTHDATGNRLTKSVGTGGAETYVYSSTSHRLSSVAGVARAYDAAGNTTKTASNRVFTFDARNRLADYRTGSATNTIVAQYQYNARGERVRKYKGSTDLGSYVYDEGGRILVEQSVNGASSVTTEVIWLDDLPVAMVRGGTVSYIEPGHLGTPRSIIDPVRDVAVWSSDVLNDAFGEATPNSNPDGDAQQFTFNLRLPGQIYDAETGLSYNYFRDYDPATGRYMESDPIGLAGGVSTFGYVGGNPLSSIDPSGLYEVVSGFQSDPRAGLNENRRRYDAYKRTPAYERERILKEWGNSFQQDLNKRCARDRKKLQPIFDSWIVKVDGDFGIGQGTDFEATTLGGVTTFYRAFYLLDHQGSTFRHEFRHLMPENQRLKGAASIGDSLTGQTAQGRNHLDADRWAQQFSSSNCGCDQ
jgi:RHS repeat-associated protein